MDLLGAMSVLIGLVALYGGFAYNKKRHENDGLDGSGADSIIGAIIALFVVIFLRLLPYQVTKTLLFIFAFICFCFSVYAFTHLH
jgi:Ca2+/Na+ antiporter